MRKPALAAALLLPLTAAALAPAVLAQDVHVRVAPGKPAASPAQAGSEEMTVFPTIQNALDHHPFAGPGGRVYIEIEPGTYHERVIVTQNHQNITLIGKGAKPEDTVISASMNAKQAGGTFFTETVEINGDGFQADNLTFENTAGNTGQAVAAAVRADRVIFKHCRFLGHQDTLFADYGRQYYVDSYLTGGVDYIFGAATAVFDRVVLDSNGPGFITAHSRTAADQTSGYVILNSKVTAHLEPGGKQGNIGLGRPWRPYARTVFIGTELPAELAPAGWNNWGKTSNEATAYYAESGNAGPGANPGARPKWTHQLTPAEAKMYLPAQFLKGKDNWNAEAEAAKLP